MSVNLIEWAEKIVFVNKENYNEAISEFTVVGYAEDIERKKIILNIPDNYDAFHPSLIAIFNEWFDTWEKS